MRDKITELLAAAQIQIVLDLEHVDYIDSTGLGNLVISYTQVKKAGGALKLLHLNKRNVELLALTRLHTIFEVFAEETDAVNSFFPGREVKHFDILSFVQQRNEAESWPPRRGSAAGKHKPGAQAGTHKPETRGGG